MEPQLNTYLGQYLLVEVIGRTASAVVYRAHQASLNRSVALKVLLRNLEPRYVSRFEREAQAIAGLQHRNILPIYDYGAQGPWRYFVMQYVEGGATLGHLIAAGPLDCVTALRLLIPLLGALEYAHAQGVIHRDIKPSNILMPWPDWPLLADFGIAKLLGAAQQLTPPGQAVGTASYMAPEAGLQRPIDGRADLYSAGVVLYELLTGHLPFEASTPLAVLTKHIKEPPPPPRSLRPDIHPAVEAALLRALEKSPDDRYQSAAEMAAALELAARQVERSKAQAWLHGQLGTGAAARRSGYTTRQLPPTAPAPAVGAAPPAPAPTPQRGLGLLLGLALLLALAVAAVTLWPRPGTLAEGPAATATPLALPTPEDEEPPAAIPPLAESPPVVEEPPPTEPPPTEPPAVTPAPAQVSERDGATLVRLDDTSWSGGYNLSRGSSRYGGRTATWIYGASTEYSAMSAVFDLADQPAGEAELIVEGMDSEGRQRTPISITVNGVEIYAGPNPLPDDDLPLETGTWASASWRFDAALLRPGRNQISIRNRAEGSFGGPPFFMLDYAELSYQG
jgi:serine/threonine-protein kinase